MGFLGGNATKGPEGGQRHIRCPILSESLVWAPSGPFVWELLMVQYTRDAHLQGTLSWYQSPIKADGETGGESSWQPTSLRMPLLSTSHLHILTASLNVH